MQSVQVQSENYHAGVMAEAVVAEKYRASGFDILGQRVRNSEGEIDVIAGHDSNLYFIEVKKSKTHERAAERLSRQQMTRIENAALQYLADMGRCLETNIRFDAALVDQAGVVKVIPNAFV